MFLVLFIQSKGLLTQSVSINVNDDVSEGLQLFNLYYLHQVSASTLTLSDDTSGIVPIPVLEHQC